MTAGDGRVATARRWERAGRGGMARRGAGSGGIRRPPGPPRVLWAGPGPRASGSRCGRNAARQDFSRSAAARPPSGIAVTAAAIRGAGREQRDQHARSA